jgi:hypothetical protein
MMDCAQYRRLILANPHDPNPELRIHLDSCRDCPEYTERLLRFESRLARALRVTAPAESGARVVPLRAPAAHASRWAPTPRARRGWLAMVASVLIVLVVGGALWLASPHPSLAADVVAHMAEEPQAWQRTDVPVPPSELALVLRDAHMRLIPDAGMVSYARSCLFRGHRVPHLVVQTEMGPVTVMVLVHESLSKPMSFDEEGYRGVILPVPGHGSLAVLARGQQAGLNAIKEIATRVQAAIVWTG